MKENFSLKRPSYLMLTMRTDMIHLNKLVLIINCYQIQIESNLIALPNLTN